VKVAVKSLEGEGDIYYEVLGKTFVSYKLRRKGEIPWLITERTENGSRNKCTEHFHHGRRPWLPSMAVTLHGELTDVETLTRGNYDKLINSGNKTWRFNATLVPPACPFTSWKSIYFLPSTSRCLVCLLECSLYVLFPPSNLLSLTRHNLIGSIILSKVEGETWELNLT
jgi:hypothetical protein